MTTMRTRVRVAAVGAGLGLLAATTYSASSALGLGPDPDFGDAGVAEHDLAAGASDRLQASATGTDGSTFHAGFTTVSGTNRAFVVTKVKADGSLDEAFANGGVVVVDVVSGPFGTGATGAAEAARGVTVRPNGKIVVVGQAETVQTAADPADVDIYAVQLNANGSKDLTFGTSGVVRVDLSEGVNGATVNRDQAGYNVDVRPNGKVVFTGSKGLSNAEPTRTDRDIVAIQLTANGLLDATFGTGGIALNTQAGVSENPRRGFVDAQGRYTTTGYGNPGTGTAPFVYRFLENGTPDPDFGTGGIATAAVAGPDPGFAEAYGAVAQGDKYIVAGYGTRSTTPEFGVDLVVYRFNSDGTHDTSFGVNGLASINRPNPAVAGTHFADRARALTVLPDKRIVTVGQSGPDAWAAVFSPEGLLDTTLGPDGYKTFDFGGDGDALWGVTVVDGGNAVVASGFGNLAANALADRSQVVKLVVKETPAPPAAVASTPGAKLVKKTVTTAQKAKVEVTVKATGISAPVGKVQVLDGKKVLKTINLGAAAKGKATVTLPKLKAGRHTITVKYLGSPAAKASASKAVTLTVKKKK